MTAPGGETTAVETLTCLVTGATGYVGGRLVPQLLAQGHRVRVLARHPDRLRDVPWAAEIDVIEGDASSEDDVARAAGDADVAYYLLHSLQEGADLEATEAAMAVAFARGVRAAGVRRIVYLGGLAPAGVDVTSLSPHMRSRVMVGKVLRASGVPTIELRAAVIIGSGSASFEMLRYLTERLPAMVTPRWVRTLTQPIAIRDVLRYLVGAAALPTEVSRVFEIGGPDVLSYEQMMARYAAVAGLRRRVIVPVVVLSPALSSQWINLVTPVPRAIARPLIESLRHDAVTHEHDIAKWIPDPPGGLLPFDDAVRLALQRIKDAHVETRWSSASVPGVSSDPIPTDPDWAGGSLYEDVREARTGASVDAVWLVLDRIGGDTGWYSSETLWEARGLIDRLMGGVGLRRGRRLPDALTVGETVDFWRVEERTPPTLLRLRAEMRAPGLAWLEFAIARDGSGARVRQRAVFIPRGLAGHLYWWAVWPFHAFIFRPMLRHIIERAEERRSSRSGTTAPS